MTAKEPPRGRSIRAGLLVALLVLTTVATVPLSGATDHNSGLPSDEIHELTENVDVWDRAALSTRTDGSSAHTRIPNAQLFVAPKNKSRIGLNYDPIPVFSVSQDIRLEMRNRTEVFTPENTNVTLIAARLVGNVSEFRDALGSVPNDDLNATAEFETVARKRTDGSGAVTFTHSPPQAGEYVYIVGTNETDAAGLVTADGNLSVDGNTTIVGLEQALVQNNRSTVSPPGTVQPGQNASFQVNSTLGPDTTNHTVLIYDRTTFTNQDFSLNLTANFTLDYDFKNNSTIEHSLDEVVGVSRIGIDGEILGVSVSPQTHSGRTGVGFLLDELANRSSFPRIPNESTGDARLHASVTATEGTQSDTVSVGTFENFSTGTYQWVHAATRSDANGTQLATRTGTFEIAAAGGAPPSGAPPGAAPPSGAPPSGDGDTPGVSVVSADLVRDRIAPGETAVVESVVENQRQSDATFRADLFVDDERVDSRHVTVPADDSIEITFTRSFDETGTYDVRVNEVSAGTLTVAEPTPTITPTPTPTEPSPTPTPTAGPPAAPPPSDGGPGPLVFGLVLVGLLAAAGAVYLFLRRTGRLG